MHGPRRVITFCLLTAVLPTVLLVIPLYLRHSVYADVSYQVTESDVLKIVEGISSVFCQEHSLKMNSTFSAYQLESEPKLSNTKKHIHMKKSMKLPDDTLEYWGFYLLNGSTMVLSACSRFEGGRVMVVRGERNLKTCGLLDRINKHQETHPIGGGSGMNKVRITFENKHDVKPENNNSNQIAKDSPITEKMPEDQKTAKDRKSFDDEDEIFIDNSKVSGEVVKRGGGGGRGEGKEEENKGSGGGKSVNSRKEIEFDEEDDDEEEGGDEEDDDEEDEEEEGGDEEDDDDVDELEGSGEGEEDDLSVEQEIKKLMERLSERKKARRKGNKVIRHEKKHLKDLGISSDGGMNLREGDRRRRRRRNLGIDNGRGIDDRMARAEKFKRVERLRRELGQEVRSRRRKKREEMNLVDGGMKHGGTALNYTKRESEEDSESSFEMGLKECYGGNIEFQEEFSPSESCSEEVTNDGSNDNEDISNPSIRVEHFIKSNGYYYYIFYSDNDRVTNEVHAAFLINKTVYEYASSSLSGDSGVVCINATECTFPVGFLSGAIVMVEVPTRDGIDRNVMDEVGGPQGAILVSSCHPRMSVYIIFPIAVLFLILGCAFL